MKKVVNFLRGSVEVEAQGAFPERFLNLCAQRGVSFWGVEWVESTAVRLKVPRQERGDLEDLAVRSGCTLSEVERGGLPILCACLCGGGLAGLVSRRKPKKKRKR